MTQFKKTSTTKGSFKGLVIHEGMLMDEETGEVVNVIDLISKVYGEDTVFDLTTTLKIDEDLDV